ncbi:MAG: PorT family protein [Spirochaetaceae bacterium]|nr:PorT family protein [Spirochaetaceae bacterium]
MKKISLILVCLLLAASLFAVDVTIGGAAGINGTFLTGLEENKDTGLRAGFEVGAFANIAVNELFSVQPELNFLLLRSGPKVENDVKSTLTAKIFEIPVLAKFSFNNFSVYLGPAVQILLGDLNAKMTYKGDEVFSIDGEPDNRVMFSGVAGIGYAVPMGNGSLSFDLRYRRQITELTEKDDSRFNTVSFRVGYGIGL